MTWFTMLSFAIPVVESSGLVRKFPGSRRRKEAIVSAAYYKSSVWDRLKLYHKTSGRTRRGIFRMV
jgi:hypothetical protein